MQCRSRALGFALCGLAALSSLAVPTTSTGATPFAQVQQAREHAPTRAASHTSRPSWTRVFRDEFRGSSLKTRKWAVYTGGQRRAENVKVSGGTLKLKTRRTSNGWTAAGISGARSLHSRYGKFVIRTRLDKGKGVRAVGLLWPTGGVWPPEVNFFEVAGDNPSRTRNLTANHYVESGQHKIQHALVRSDYTRWHRIGVVWRPGRLTYLLDGKVAAVVHDRAPQRDMWLGLQTATGTGDGAPAARTPRVVDFEVDWVRIFTRRS